MSFNVELLKSKSFRPFLLGGNKVNFMRRTAMIRGLVAVMTIISCFMPVSATVVLSDDFNRENSTSLGSTEQGYLWQKRVLREVIGKEPNPYIANNMLTWGSYGNGNSVTYIDKEDLGSTYNFVMDITYTRISVPNTGTNEGDIYFRMADPGDIRSDASPSAGYQIYITVQNIDEQYKARLILAQDYETTGCSTTWDMDYGDMTVDLRIVAQGNNIKVYGDGVLRFDYTDTTANPSASDSQYGYFTLAHNEYVQGAFDNLSVSTIPEPVSLAFLSLAGLLLPKKYNN